MLQLSQDESFHYELLRTLSHARYYGSDVGEVLEASGAITAGDIESFSAAFDVLAARVYKQAEAVDATKYPVTARDTYFRASTYFRAADFYLHGKAADPRVKDLWDKQTAAFNKAIALLPIPAERVTLRAADGSFSIPCIFFRAQGATAGSPKPTIILGNGYDGAQEEMLHVSGFAALERGYNVITYEGPGQPTVRRDQGLGFITEWEKVVTPVVDYLLARPEVDSKRIALLGYSMGGWLAMRAAAFEHRLAGVLAVDGVFDVFQAYMNKIPPQVQAIWGPEHFAAIDKQFLDQMAEGTTPTVLRWGVEQGIWSFNVKTPSEFMEKTRPMTLKNIVHQVRCPVWVGCGADDLFFEGQPEQLRDALGSLATYRKLTAEDGASNHCHVGGMSKVNGELFGWFDKIAGSSGQVQSSPPQAHSSHQPHSSSQPHSSHQPHAS